MNKMLSIVFLLFGFLLFLNFGYSALPTGCVYRDLEFKIQCEFKYAQINMNLDSIKLGYPDYKLIDITLNSPEPYNNYKITFNNQNETNLDIKITSKRYDEKNFVELIFNNSKKTIISKLSLINNKTITINGKNLTTINQFIPLVTTNTKPQTTQFNSLNINDMVISGKNIINFEALSDYNINKITFLYNSILQINSDKVIGINELLYAKNFSSNVPIIINKFNLSDNSNLDLNLILGPVIGNKITLKNISDSNINLSYINNISNKDNIQNIINLENSENIIINGFEYNKINNINLTNPTNMLNINNSNGITIQGFKLYSDTGTQNSKLNYIDLNNSLAIIHSNVFNDANAAINAKDSNILIYSNSFYNVEKVFQEYPSESEIMFFNNFLYGITKLSNLTINIKNILSLNDGNSIGPVLDSQNYSCIENYISFRYFNSNTSDRNIPLYYYTNSGYVKKNYAPQCIGGNLYANKTIPEICGNQCYNILIEQVESKDKPFDLISNKSESILSTNIIDNAPLMLSEELLPIYTVNNEDLNMKIQIIKQKEVYNKNDDLNFQILITINPDTIYNSYYFLKLLGIEQTYYFDYILVNNIKIPLDVRKTADNLLLNYDCNPLTYTCSANINATYDLIFKDLNFKINAKELLKTNEIDFKFELYYTISTEGQFCRTFSNSPLCKEITKSISYSIPINIEGSAPTIKTPDNNIFVIAILCLSIVSLYFINRRKQMNSKRK